MHGAVQAEDAPQPNHRQRVEMTAQGRPGHDRSRQSVDQVLQWECFGDVAQEAGKAHPRQRLDGLQRGAAAELIDRE